jgi:glycosyltransferase involved in cell wall biosynthesis
VEDRIRVLHVGDKFGIAGATVHGVTRLFSWWFNRWDKSAFDCRLVGLRRFDNSAQFLVDSGVPVKCLDKGKFDPTTLLALVNIIRSDRIDLVHLHGYGSSDFGRLAARLTGIPAVIHEHFVDPAIPSYQRIADRHLARFTDMGVGVSNSVVDFLERERHVPRDRLRMVPNGAPLSDYQPTSEAEAADMREQLQIPSDRPVIGTIGRLNAQKGVTYLIKAVKLLIENGQRVTLLVVGDGDLREALEGEARELGIADHVIFTGFSSDTRSLQTIFDIQAFPSLFEGTPLTLFEAMSMARPIVSTGVDGLGEVLVDGETALLIPARDPPALAQAIVRLLEQPELSRRLANAAKEASKAYDIQQAVDSLQAIYREVLGIGAPVAVAQNRNATESVGTSCIRE